jgi:hypothetical protein
MAREVGKIAQIAVEFHLILPGKSSGVQAFLHLIHSAYMQRVMIQPCPCAFLR